MVRDEVIFEDNFESSVSDKISGGVIEDYNSSKVLGNYNNDGFTVHLDNIGIMIIFFYHLTYIFMEPDGNSNGFSENDQADKWIIDFKPDMSLHSNDNSSKFITTFSNSPCWSTLLLQSYPEQFPFDNNPKGHEN